MTTTNDNEDLSQAPSETLAAIVVAYKSLGFNKSLALKAMAELSLRESKGDEFNYNKFIEDELQKIPKVEISNIGDILKSIKKQINL